MGPLDGFRIVDLTTVFMGPYLTQSLADMGADVVKIEPPTGDIVRQIGPSRNEGMGSLFLNLNRGKRSVALDLKRPEGRAALMRIVRNADALVYNVRPQAMARLGLTYDQVSEVNPKIVYAGVYGYGEEGPYAGRPAYDDLIQGVSGVSALIARAGDGTPRYAPVALADRVVSLFGLNNVIAGLLARERTGRGQKIDVPMFETMASFVLGDHMGGLTFEPRMDRGGYQRLLTPHRKPFKTRDGHVCAVIYTDRNWKDFFAALGSNKAAVDPRFASHTTRTRHIDEIYAEIAEVFVTKTTDEWVRLLTEADIPVMPMNDLEDLLEDPHLVAVGLISVIEHPTEGAIRSLRYPSRWSDTQPVAGGPCPHLGQHTSEVLAEAGLSEKEVAELQSSHVAFGS